MVLHLKRHPDALVVNVHAKPLTAFSGSQQWFPICRALRAGLTLERIETLHVAILNFIFTIFPKVEKRSVTREIKQTIKRKRREGQGIPGKKNRL